MKVQLVIFDMDGTILDTLEDLKNSLNFSLKKNGFAPRTLDEVRRFVGNGIRKLVERGVPAAATAEQIDEVFACFNEYYAVHCADHTHAYPGIEELLKRLRAEGVRTAVVSNKSDYAVQSLSKQYFDGLLDSAVGARDGVRKKPSPDSVNEVLKELSVPREAAVYVGDSDVDIATAKNAGMPCISVDWGFRDREFLRENGATQIVSDAEALYRALSEKA